MILFTSYYSEKNSSRKNELLYCINRNIANDLITGIYILCDSGFEDLATIQSDKLKIIKKQERPSFKDFIYELNRKNPLEKKIISNTDIIFDESLLFVKGEMQKKHVYCLTRWEFSRMEGPRFYENFKSQDAWIFQGHLPENIGNYYMGLPGCDNRFAKELMDSGFKIKNPCLTIRAIHVHISDLRNYNKSVDRVYGDYAYPLPEELENHKTIWGLNKEKEIRQKYLHRKWKNDLEGISFSLIQRLIAKTFLVYSRYCKI
jgi:hypothetical protein